MPLIVNGYAVSEIRMNGAVITDKPQRLKTCHINTSDGTVSYSLEGDENQYGITFEVDQETNKITYTWPDGFTCEVSIE